DQLFASVRILGQEIDLVTTCCADVGDLRTAPLQLQQYAGFQRVAEIGPARAVVYRNQAGIDGIDLARVHHAATFRVDGDGKRADQKRILQITEVRVQRVLGHRNPL